MLRLTFQSHVRMKPETAKKMHKTGRFLTVQVSCAQFYRIRLETTESSQPAIGVVARPDGSMIKKWQYAGARAVARCWKADK
jgi:hypothetical protein